MSQFPAMEAKVAYDHLTFRSTVDALRAETPLDWNDFWVRVRDGKIMARVARAMLHAAAVELCEPVILEENNPVAASISVGSSTAPAGPKPAKDDAEKQETVSTVSKRTSNIHSL